MRTRVLDNRNTFDIHFFLLRIFRSVSLSYKIICTCRTGLVFMRYFREVCALHVPYRNLFFARAIRNFILSSVFISAAMFCIAGVGACANDMVDARTQ